MWANPNELFGILICTKSEYAETLISKGTMKLNTPLSWVDHSKKYGNGRGDLLEGAFAACNPFSIQKVIEYHSSYYDVYGEIINDLVYFRRKRTMNLPCFCFFILMQDIFECPKNTGIQDITGKIPAEYFRDFADKKEYEDIQKLPKKDQPSIVYIKNFPEFRSKLENKLSEIGVKKHEIIIEQIKYENKKIPFHCIGVTRKELSLKDTTFSHQREGRIILNIDDPILLNYFSKNTIEIGTLAGIAEKKDRYLYGGMRIELTADIGKPSPCL